MDAQMTASDDRLMFVCNATCELLKELKSFEYKHADPEKSVVNRAPSMSENVMQSK